MRTEKRKEEKLKEFLRDLELAFGIFGGEIDVEDLRREWDRKR